ncbi:MAG TPA: hypothetical protein DEP84_26095 [Chloroflexi bacterium]|nr:hypothetical protein [Chloroflexota bacterium]
MKRQPDPIKLLLGEGPTFSLDRKTTALLVVDLNVNDAHPDGAVARLARRRGVFDLFTSYYERIHDVVVPNVQKLLAAAREAGLTIIYLTTVSPVPIGGGSTTESDEIDSAACIPVAGLESTDAQVLDEIAPRNGDLLVTKQTSGAFNSSMLDQVLRNLGIKVLVVVGVATHRCVELTVRDAADRGYGILVVADACADFTETLHEDALNRMDDGSRTEIGTTAEVLRRLSHLARTGDVTGDWEGFRAGPSSKEGSNGST